MRNEPIRNVVKVWVYALASVLLGAWITPLIYDAGKALAEVSEAKQTNSAFHWVAAVSRKSDFPSFFSASLFIAAALLFLPFAEWFGGGRGGNGLGKLTRLLIPDASTGISNKKTPGEIRLALAAFLQVTTLFLFIAAAMCLTGLLTWTTPAQSAFGLVSRALVFAVATGLAQEMVFRGIVTGIFLKAMRPALAIGTAAALSALSLFLYPPGGLDIADPEAAGAGFELLGKIVRQLADPVHFTTSLLPLLVLCEILTYARWRTASLWLSTGINAGWIFACSMTVQATTPSPARGTFARLLGGESMDQGLLALAGIIATGFMIKQLLPPPHNGSDTAT